jgi:hypothetical protein
VWGWSAVDETGHSRCLCQALRAASLQTAGQFWVDPPAIANCCAMIWTLAALITCVSHISAAAFAPLLCLSPADGMTHVSSLSQFMLAHPGGAAAGASGGSGGGAHNPRPGGGLGDSALGGHSHAAGAGFPRGMSIVGGPGGATSLDLDPIGSAGRMGSIEWFLSSLTPGAGGTHGTGETTSVPTSCAPPTSMAPGNPPPLFPTPSHHASVTTESAGQRSNNGPPAPYIKREQAEVA